jgi:hypothetical protein
MGRLLMSCFFQFLEAKSTYFCHTESSTVLIRRALGKPQSHARIVGRGIFLPFFKTLQVTDNTQAFEVKIEFVDRKNTNLRAGFIRQLDFNSCATAGVSTSNGKGN